MDFEFTEEQRWLAESVEELLTREPADRLWQSLVEFGALEVGADGGLGVVEQALVARAVGAHLAAVAYAETAAAQAVVDLGGRSVAACVSEPGRAFAPSDPSTSLENNLVTGEKTGVAYGAKAELLAVPAMADEAGSLQQDVTSCSWEISVPSSDDLSVRVDAVLASPVLRVQRERKGHTTEDDIRPAIKELAAHSGALRCSPSRR